MTDSEFWAQAYLAVLASGARLSAARATANAALQAWHDACPNDAAPPLVPFFRLQGHGDHLYTCSPEERDSAIADYGYTYEGIACYVKAPV